MNRPRGKRVSRNCEACGIEFDVLAYEVKRGRGRMCSHRCAASVATAGTDRSGPKNNRWKGSRALVGYAAAKRRYTARHPEKTLAHRLVRDALKRGDLTQESCEVCGEAKAEAHHDDYSKPLAVRWLCRQHHKEHHIKMREMGLEQYAQPQ